MRRWEHLLLQPKVGFVGMGNYCTDRHPDLGADLQQALRALEEEGWEVACSVPQHGHVTVLILKRLRGQDDASDR